MKEQLSVLQQISPFVRLVKISHRDQLEGEWIDFDHVFTYIEQGEATFILDGTQYCVKAGDVVIMTPLMLHFIQSSAAIPLIQYIIHFDLFADSNRQQWKEVGITCDEQRIVPANETLFVGIHPIASVSPSNQLYIKRRFLTLMQLSLTRDEPFVAVQMKAVLLELLAIFFRSQMQGTSSYGKKTKSWYAIEQSVHYIYEHYHEVSLDRNMIAQHVSVSPNHLSYLFKEQLHISLHKFISQLRIERAKKLILSEQFTLTEIAEAVGFSSIYTFSRAFKAIAGVTASHFQQLHRHE